MLSYIGVLLALSSSDPEPADGACGMFSQDVYASANAWSGCELKRAGEKPLWNSSNDANDKQVYRLVFSSGRDSSFRFVTIQKNSDGKAIVVSGGLDAPYRKPRKQWPKQKNPISLDLLDQVSSLANASGSFDHEIGTWDGDEIYMHCHNLSIERLDNSGYRFSSVSIGCNRPEKLEPLIAKIVEVADRKRLFEGWFPD